MFQEVLDCSETNIMNMDGSADLVDSAAVRVLFPDERRHGRI